jgi:hypothetical protein
MDHLRSPQLRHRGGRWFHLIVAVPLGEFLAGLGRKLFEVLAELGGQVGELLVQPFYFLAHPCGAVAVLPCFREFGWFCAKERLFSVAGIRPVHEEAWQGKGGREGGRERAGSAGCCGHSRSQPKKGGAHLVHSD